MKLRIFTAIPALISAVVAISLFSTASYAAESSSAATAPQSGEICQGYGPQTPRDIDNKSGSNSVTFDLDTSSADMNLCNIHFHNNAEHKAKAFSILAGEGDSQGYQCGISKTLSEAELNAPSGESRIRFMPIRSLREPRTAC